MKRDFFFDLLHYTTYEAGYDMKLTYELYKMEDKHNITGIGRNRRFTLSDYAKHQS